MSEIQRAFSNDVVFAMHKATLEKYAAEVADKAISEWAEKNGLDPTDPETAQMLDVARAWYAEGWLTGLHKTPKSVKRARNRRPRRRQDDRQPRTTPRVRDLHLPMWNGEGLPWE